jgi:hypothetical protein
MVFFFIQLTYVDIGDQQLQPNNFELDEFQIQVEM